MISYAQNFEDVMLWRALKHVERGFYIDIGAQDPVVDSVSLGFYEEGWRGVHVEPTPAYAQALRNARPDETVVQAAIGDESELIPFFEIAGTGISTGDAAIAHRHEAAGYANKRIGVPCIRLASLLDNYQGRDIHWMKIDVEGMELSVLRSWAPSTARPWIVVLESTLPMSQQQSHEEWERLILGLSYRFAHFDGLNRFYVSEQHRELLKCFLAPPNIFDGFVLAGTASHSFCAKLNAAVVQARHDVDQLKRQSAEQVGHASGQIREAREEVARLRLQQAEQIDRTLLQLDHAREERLELLRHLGARDHVHAAQLASIQDESARLRQELLEHAAVINDVRPRLLISQTEATALRAELAQAREDASTRLAEQRMLLTGSEQARAQERQEMLGRLREQEESSKSQLASTHADALQLQLRLLDELAVLSDKLLALRIGPFDKLLGALGLSSQPQLRRHAHRASESVGSQPSDSSEVAAPLPVTCSQDPREEIYAELTMLDNLLVLNDVNFVRAAYRTLLKREADPPGERNHVQLLQAGIDKVVLLRDIARSKEGQQAGVVLPGLSRAVWRRRVARVPMLGPLTIQVLSLLRRSPDHDVVSAYRSQSIGIQRLTLDLVSQMQASMQALQTQQSRMEEAIQRLGNQHGLLTTNGGSDALMRRLARGAEATRFDSMLSVDSRSASPDSEDPQQLQIQLMREAAAWKA